MRVSFVLSVLLVSVYARTAYICNVRLAGYPDAEVEPTIALQGQSYRFIDIFNVISFGGYAGNSGDVEGRAAVRNDVSVSSYSFGAVLVTSGPTAFSQHVPYSLVAGGNVNFNGGALFPQGTGTPFPGQKEYMYIGQSFTGSDYLRNDPLFSQNTGRLDAYFDSALQYYKDLSDAFAAVTPNAHAVVQYGGVTFTCNDAAATSYSVNINANDFNTISSYHTAVNCAVGAQIVINVVGGTTVDFNGDNIYSPSNDKVLYNINNGATIRVGTEVRGSILAPRSTYTQQGGVVKGIVIAGDVTSTLQINLLSNCVPPQDTTTPPPANECPAFEGDCTGFNLDLGAAGIFSFKDFNAISFGDFTAESGDVEGRLAVRGSATLDAYSVGYELDTTGSDRDLPYALIVGGDLTFLGGAVYPQGNGIPRAGAQENIFVGGTFTGADYLAAQVTGTGDLSAQFDAAQQCYIAVSNNIANQGDNVQKTIQDSGAFLTCNDASSTYNYVSFTPEDLAQFTYFSLSNCNFNAFWFINIRGSGDVTLSGDSFPAIPGGVVYNIIDSTGSRTVNVQDTSVNGHLLAPLSTLSQTGGVIRGKVVAGNVVASLQINRENTCQTTVPVSFAIVASSRVLITSIRARSTETTVQFVGTQNIGFYQENESVYSNSQPDAEPTGYVHDIDTAAGTLQVTYYGSNERSEKRLNNYNAYVQRLSTQAQVSSSTNNDADSSASALGYCVASLVIAVLAL